MATQNAGTGARDADTRRYLEAAARLALRAFGDVEPNPMVGAVIVRDGRVIGMGHHRKFGGLHAEREALADCRRRAEDPRGATVYVTLEPCRHFGKQPPCTDALIEVGVARVVAARADPNPVSGSGAGVLRRAGIACEFTDESRLAGAISDPFVRGMALGLPWVIAKWAQTEDGRLITRPGEPRWISGEVSRRRVHRLRARVDAVLTGMGTVLADDPTLTTRGVRVHRVARRIVLDPALGLPLQSKLARSARQVPVVALCAGEACHHAAGQRRLLEDAGVEIVPVPESGGRIAMGGMLRELRGRFGLTTVLLEAGPKLLSQMFDEQAVDAAMVHIPGHLTPADAHAAVARVAPALAEITRFTLCRVRRSGDDTELLYWRVNASRI